MTVWSDIKTADEFIQKIATQWTANIKPGDWCCKAVADLDGTIVVLYYHQETGKPFRRVSYARLPDPWK